MKAIILAAGYGKRLKSLTLKKPKCLLKIKGKPIIDLWIEKLIRVGVSEILINTHYKSKIVKAHISKSMYRSKIKLTYEKNLLGSAGTLMKNINFCENHDIFLIHADNYTQESLRKFYNFFLKMKKKKCLISLISFKSNDYKQKGILKIKNGIVHEIYEKEKVSHGTDANGAVYLIGKEALSEMFKKYKDKKDFIKKLLVKYLLKISAFKTNKIFQDIGSIRDYISVR